MSNKKINRLVLDEVPEEEIYLIALYSSLEIFRVVYHLNSKLGLRLKRTLKDIDFVNPDSTSKYPLYHFYDEINDVDYYVVANKAKVKPRHLVASGLMFEDADTYQTYLIPERKNVDFFLKIEKRIGIDDFLNKLKNLKQFSAVYAEDINRIRSYKNLIFD
ncbi:MAG TPA: IPExxxVDY family protein [Flavobacteriaceae bacterium]|nr:IPExxxVDY family protein [Flavobacteriaceae bacterium]